MYLIASEYLDSRNMKRTIWWGKGKHYIVLKSWEEPSKKWKESYAMLELSSVERKSEKLPTSIWIDGRPFSLETTMILRV